MSKNCKTAMRVNSFIISEEKVPDLIIASTITKPYQNIQIQNKNYQVLLSLFLHTHGIGKDRKMALKYATKVIRTVIACWHLVLLSWQTKQN